MSGAHRALDELRFGQDRTLNLRESLPTAGQAVRRCEGWLRSHQVKGSHEVLVITGRGSHSIDGVPVLKPAIEKLLHSLRRRGVVDGHTEHNPGAFVVRLAPLRALSEAPRRRREAGTPALSFGFSGLDGDVQALLRDLAERSLHSLGVALTDARVSDEMHRQISILAPAVRHSPDPQAVLRAALRRAIAEFD